MWTSNIIDRNYYSLNIKSKNKRSVPLEVMSSTLRYKSSDNRIKNNKSLKFNSNSPWNLNDQSDAHTTLYGMANKIY